jgi:NAD(P)-dependent dehydrogenase (short-subunit alcohol dehydrogenase family)
MPMLEDKAVVVTGAAAGLGRAHALAAADAGAAVVVNDVDGDSANAVVEEIAAAGGRALAAVGSVSDYETARSLMVTCVDAFGAIDGLVNNAAVFHRGAPADETEAGLREIVEVNVLGSLFCALHAFEAMRAVGAGAILNVVSGAHVGLPEMTAYGTTKGAVASLTYNLALEGHTCGIRVNALSPVAQTAMSAGSSARADGVTRPRPDAISPAVVFMLSERAAGITGQVLRFDARSLSFMAAPHFRTRRVAARTWTAEAIAELYERELRDERSPLGLFAEAQPTAERGA